jgi:nicotinamide riboside kinase
VAQPQSRKIAFIGTHGVGKTVLTFSLTAKLRSLGIDADAVTEVSRLSPFPINEATTLDGQLWILAAQWRAELEASLRTALVVCDRALIDNYAYLVRAAGEQPHLHPLLEQWSRTYDLYFLVPIIDEAIVADKKRATARGFQEEIQERVRGLVSQFGLTDRVVELPPRREEHLDVILATLRQRRVLPRRQLMLFDDR